MIGFMPTADQEAIRNLAHQVAVEQFRPLARMAEEVSGIPATLLRVLDQTGLADPFTSVGPGFAHESSARDSCGALDAVTLALVTEELGFGDGGLALALVGRWLGPLALLIAATPEQRQTHLVGASVARDTMGLAPDIIGAAPDVEGAALAYAPIAVALAEEAAGLDLSSLNTTARVDGPRYLLNGTKYAVLLGQAARQYVVLANAELEAGRTGLRLFFVPAESEGVHATPDERPLGLRAAPLSRLRLFDVRVPADALLGRPEAGSGNVLRLLSLYAMLLGGVAVGISRAALEYSVDYARTRVQFGRPIAAFQGVAFQGAEMAMCTDAARLLLWRAASAWDAGDTGWDAAWTAYRKAYAVATQVTADAIQILGGAGYMEDHPLELWMRDAAALAALGDPLMGGALAAPASA